MSGEPMQTFHTPQSNWSTEKTIGMKILESEQNLVYYGPQRYAVVTVQGARWFKQSVQRPEPVHLKLFTWFVVRPHTRRPAMGSTCTWYWLRTWAYPEPRDPPSLEYGVITLRYNPLYESDGYEAAHCF